MNPIATQKLYRSDNYGVLGGVCAGLALSRGWSIGLVRLLALVIVLTTGVGALVYVAAWILFPRAATLGVAEPATLPQDPLRRSRDDRMLGGVCGGVAQAFGWDSNLVRVVFVFLFLCGGVGLVPYLYAWIAFPMQTQPFAPPLA